MKKLSETQKLNESRTNTERAEQMILWVPYLLFLLTMLAMGLFIELVILPAIN